jgi:hypothetical protein
MKTARARSGMILAGVLLMIVLSAMVAATLMFRIRAESLAATADDRDEAARAATMSAVQHVLAVLAEHGRDPLIWRDNPDLFQQRFVTSQGGQEWYFSVYSPAGEGDEQVRFGLTGEAGKVNINTAGEELLLSLPGMDSAAVDCLLDYRDRDDEPRPMGAEQNAYNFQIRNRPIIWTLEELLVVQGFTPEIVYGEDVNFNGLLDANENDGDESFPPDDADGLLNRGLKGLCTVRSYEYDVDSRGRPRVNVNGNPGAVRGAGLGDTTVEFLQAWKQQKRQPFGHPADLLGASIEVEREVGRGRRKRTRRVRITSGVTAENLDVALDRLTARSGGGRKQRVRGLVDVNTASPRVLEALLTSLELPTDLAGAIVDLRSQLEPEQLATIAWVHTAGAVPEAEDFKKLAPHITARCLQMRFYVVAYAIPAGNYRVMEAVVDLAGPSPRIAYQRDLTRLPLSVEVDTDPQEIRY